MELEAEGWRFAVMKAHEGSVVLRDGVDDQVGWEARERCGEAVVAADGHAVMVGRKESAGGNAEGRGLAVARFGCPAYAPAERVNDALVAEADAEDGNAAVEGADQVEAVGCLLGGSRAGAEEEGLRRSVGEAAGERAVGSHDLYHHPHRGKGVDEVERKGVAVVYEEEHGRRLRAGRLAAWTKRSQLSRMGRWVQAFRYGQFA